MEDLSDVLSVNNSSVEGIHDHITLGVHLGNNIVSELVNSPFHVVVGIIGVSDGIVSGLKDIILLFFQKSNLILEWSTDLIIIIFLDLEESSLSSLLDLSNIVNSVLVSFSNPGFDVGKHGVVVSIVKVKVWLNAIVTVDMVLVGMVLVSAVGILVTVVSSGAVVGNSTVR